MPAPFPRYSYVGPADLLDARSTAYEGAPIRALHDLAAWREGRSKGELDEPFTFVVDLQGQLRLAPRRSEHVACADGEDVLAAGEIRLGDRASGWRVEEVSNHSTGYCPGPESWPAVAAALAQAGMTAPDCFTHVVIFRRCPSCGQINIVRDEHYICAVCDFELSR